jgi:DNA-binding MarR family transcriptional regulator
MRYLRESVPQRRLAELLGCDPARVTHIVNGLTARGLAERRRGGDRRVRYVTLTPAGSAAVDRIGARLYATSPLVHALDSHERQRLAALLLRLVHDDGPHVDTAPA